MDKFNSKMEGGEEQGMNSVWFPVSGGWQGKGGIKVSRYLGKTWNLEHGALCPGYYVYLDTSTPTYLDTALPGIQHIYGCLGHGAIGKLQKRLLIKFL